MHELTNKYRCIIFDFDGTINDTSPGIYATFRKVLSHFGVDYSDVDLSRHIGPPLEYTYEHLVGKQNMDEAIKLHYKVFADDNAAQNSHLYDGIKQTIAALKNHGYVIAIASSKYEPHAVESLAYFGLSQYFDYVYGQTERRGYKIEVLRQLIDDHNWDRSKCLMIGDTFYDAEGAAANKVDFLAVSYGFGHMNELLKGNPVAIADSPKQIADLLL